MDDDMKAVQQAAYDFERHHDETLVAILVAGLRATSGVYDHPATIIEKALADLAEIRRQLKGEG